MRIEKIKSLWRRIPPGTKSFAGTTFKVLVTIGAFYLLFTHKIPVRDRITVELPQGEKVEILAGAELLVIGAGRGIVEDARLVKTGNSEIRLQTGAEIGLLDGRRGQVAPVGKITTFSAIRSYLPKIAGGPFIVFCLLAAVIKFIGILCSMLRWHVLLIGQGIRFPFGHIFGTFLVGRFLGTFLPSTIGLDGYKLYDAAHFSKKGVESAAATVIEKLFGIMGIFLTFLITLPFGYQILGRRAPVIIGITIPVAFAAIFGFMVLLFYPQIIKFFLSHIPMPGKGRIEGIVERVNRSAAAYRDKKKLLLVVLILSFALHFTTAVMYHFTALAVGAVRADFWAVTFASTIQIFATVISPFTIAGEGVREIVQALLLARRIGVSESIISAALGFWAAEALTLFGVFFWWARRGGYRPRFVRVDGRDLAEVRTMGAKTPFDPKAAKEGL